MYAPWLESADGVYGGPHAFLCLALMGSLPSGFVGWVSGPSSTTRYSSEVSTSTHRQV